MAKICIVLGLLTLCFPIFSNGKAVDEFETYIDEVGGSSLIAPDDIRLSFMAQLQNRVNLNLTRNRNIRTDIPVLLGTDGRVEEWDRGRDMQYHSYYVNKEHKASVLMKATPRADGSVLRKYSGWFSYDETDYHFEPVEITTYRKKRDFATQRAAYTFKRVEQKFEDWLPDYARDIPAMREVQQFEDQTIALGYNHAQDNTDASGQHQYYAELFIVLDYSTFERMYRMGTKIDTRDREDEAVENLKYYFSHVVNGVDLRYRTLENDQYSIYVKLVGLYIAMSPGESPWTEIGKEWEDGWSNAFVDAYTALDDFELWLNKTKTVLPNFDHAALVTSYQLYGSIRSDGTHRRISGLSDIKGVCTYWRASINQDRGPFPTSLTLTHELGHSFGAYHDGSQNTCSSSDQYIMASSPGVVTDDNYLNNWRFSPCTITEFTKHLTFLNMMGMNCLVNTAFNHYDQALVNYHLQTPPGQLFTIEQQCQYMHDTPSSYYCGGANNDRDICRVLECYHPDYERCYSSVEQRAANGTSCGHKKWCMLGDCVEDDRAPPFIDYCWSGDYKGLFYDRRNCDEVVRDSKWLCYDEKYRDACCERCESVRDKSNELCPYGDQGEWCKDITRRDCYTQRVRDVCCEACDRFNTGIEYCEFGDRASWCASMTPGMCYNNEDTCCAKCRAFRVRSNNPSSCVYGDKASWCATVTAAQCYTIESTCCNTCKRFRTGLLGCKYGNVGVSCAGKDCTDPYWVERCCLECYDYVDLSAIDESTTTHRTPLPPVTPAPTTTTTRSTTTTTTRRTTTRSTPSSRYTTTTATYEGPVNYQCEMDKAPWCRNLPKSRCYLDNEVCCATCPTHYTGVEGCEFGDHASWCNFIFRGNCYGELYQRQCCETCPNQVDLSAPLDCMYGDRYTWCVEIMPEECEDREKRYACCETCDNFLRQTSTTTTTTTTTTRPPTTTSSTNQGKPTSTSTTTEVIPIDGCLAEDASWCMNNLPASYCYTVSDACCRTCKTMWRDVPGCEYGDHFTWCKQLTSFQCRDDYYRNECCEQCSQFETTTTVSPLPEACEDEASWCPNVHAGQCYSVLDICCQTCALAQTNVQDKVKENSGFGCEYGDHYASCENLQRRECYFRSYRDACCQTCTMLKSDDPACLWGDRYMDCRGADCSDPKILEYCCETCSTMSVTQMTTTLSPLSPECTDDATWCPTIPPRDCYVSDHVCCRTCVGHYTGLPSCIYGDEVSWCSNVIFDLEDCHKPTIGPFCCLTCRSISLRAGYGWVPEPDSEVYEGALVVLQDTTVDEMLQREPKLLELLSVYLDEYCSIEVQKCCEMAWMDERDPPLDYSKRRHRYFQKTHCHIGAGYPRKINALDVITKVLARIPLEYMDTMCMESKNRWKRGVKARQQIFYVDKHLLYDLLTQNQLVFEQKIRLEISRVTPVEPEEPVSEKKLNWALIIGIIALVGVLILVVIVTLIICHRRKKRRAKQAARNLDRSTSTISTANLYQPNSYQWLEDQKEAERRENEKTLQRAKILEEMIHERALEKARAIESPMPSVHFKPQPSRSNIETTDAESYEHISIQKPD